MEGFAEDEQLEEVLEGEVGGVLCTGRLGGEATVQISGQPERRQEDESGRRVQMVTNKRQGLAEQRESVSSLILKDDIGRLVTKPLLSIYINQSLAHKHLYHKVIIVNDQILL